MRRKDRQRSPDEGMGYIDRSVYGILSLADEASPSGSYSLPLSFARLGNALYFHSAKAGYKVDLFARAGASEKGAPVRVCLVSLAEVPELYSRTELETMVNEKTISPAILAGIFTTEFESAIVEGRLFEVQDEAEKLKGLFAISEKYTSDKMFLFDAMIQDAVAYTAVYRVDIDSVEAKAKRYDENGREIKAV